MILIEKIKQFYLILIILLALILQTDYQKLEALQMENYKNEIVIEELRLKVPAQFKDVWIKTEKKIWEPWLSTQDGFLGRQLFWDKEKEEALILVNWESKELWKNIQLNEVNRIQLKFEEDVKISLNLNENPFKLISEGELTEQG